MAIVVLPVLRSPMMSSRWPAADRRHGVDDLDPGLQRLGHRLARHDARRLDLEAAFDGVAERPLAVDRLARAGSPRDPRERRRPAPKGSGRSSGRPGPRRALPSFPSTTAPIDSSSRLRARPTVPFSNSSNSLTVAPGRPVTRAMPSPTSVMRPTCSASVAAVKSLRFRASAAAMSSALIVSSGIGEGPLLVRLVRNRHGRIGRRVPSRPRGQGFRGAGRAGVARSRR